MRFYSIIALVLFISQESHAAESGCAHVTNTNFTADFHPASRPGLRGILVLGGSSGGIPTDLAELASLSGHAVLALAYFKENGLPAELEMIPLEYFEQPVQWLLNRKETNSNGLIVIGWSKGAELALLLASRDRRICGAVAISPSSVVWAGILMNWDRTPSSSWSSGGMPLPFVPYAPQKERKGLLEMYNASLDAAQGLDGAVIPVEKINCPVLLISGGNDNLWPAARMARSICDRANRKGSQFAFSHLCFAHGGHLPNEQQSAPYIDRNGSTNMVSPQTAILNFIQELELTCHQPRH